MKKSTAALLVSVFLLLSLLLVLYFNVTSPRVLVLHSYEEDFGWVQALERSYRKELKNYPRSVLTRWHYMGLSGAPSAQHIETAAASVHRAVEAFEPDVLVVFDDIAAQVVTPTWLNRADVRIVFAGIDAELATHGFESATNTTGILERLPLAALHEALTHLGRGKPLTIACLGDALELAQAESRQLAAYDWSPHRLLPCEQADSFPGWQAHVHQLGARADVLFVTGYRGLHREGGSGKVVPAAEVVTWTETESKALPLSAKNGFVPDGGGLAISSSPQEHGQTAGRLTAALLQGRAPADLPVTEGRAFVVSIHAERLARRGYRLPAVYEAAARAAGTFN
ncbi:MAG: hypothetical protein Q8K91_11815 [Hylemonella sp.]|nr:hypothetical protein [Hylemonella sp.]MDP1937884.1 hypothetical protein [Hylemonella sp.]